MSFTKKVTSLSLVAVLFLAPVVSVYAQQSDQAGTALHEGRRLLKRGQADKALIQLKNALNLYTAAKNNSGMAAAHNELGDLYLRQGQYQVALDHYQKPFDGFIAGDPKEEAATFAYKTLAFPMLTGSFVTIAGFVPIGFAASAAGEYTFSIFAVVSIAVVASWFVAVLFIPLLGVAFLSRPR